MAKPLPLVPIAAGAGVAYLAWRYVMPERTNEEPSAGAAPMRAKDLEDARDYRDAFGDFGGMAADATPYVVSPPPAVAPSSDAPPPSTPALASVSAPPSSYRAPQSAAKTTTGAARPKAPETPGDRLAALWDGLTARLRGGR